MGKQIDGLTEMYVCHGCQLIERGMKTETSPPLGLGLYWDRDYRCWRGLPIFPC